MDDRHPIERRALRLGMGREELAEALECSQPYLSLLFSGQRFGSPEFWDVVEEWSGGKVTWAKGRAWWKEHGIGSQQTRNVG